MIMPSWCLDDKTEWWHSQRNAAAVIQARVRGRKAREELRLQEHAARLIQLHVRTREAREDARLLALVPKNNEEALALELQKRVGMQLVAPQLTVEAKEKELPLQDFSPARITSARAMVLHGGRLIPATQWAAWGGAAADAQGCWLCI